MRINPRATHAATPAVAKSAPAVGPVCPGSGAKSPTRAGGPAAMSDQRTEAIRRSVLAGSYNSPAVMDEIARRMLASGDLDS